MTPDINREAWTRSEAALELLAKEVPEWLQPPGRRVIALAGQVPWGDPKKNDPSEVAHTKTVDGVLLHEGVGGLASTIVEFKTDRAGLKKGLGQGLRYWWQPIRHGKQADIYAQAVINKITGSVRKRFSAGATGDLDVQCIGRTLTQGEILLVDGSGSQPVYRKVLPTDAAGLARFINDRWKSCKAAKGDKYINLAEEVKREYFQDAAGEGAGVVIRQASARVWWPKEPCRVGGRAVYVLVGAILLPETGRDGGIVAEQPGPDIKAKLGAEVDRLAGLLPNEPVAIGQAIYLGEDDLGCRWACRLLGRPA